MSNKRAQTHAGVAAVLSFVFSGIGQIYNGQIRKGLFHIALATTGVVFVLIGALILAVSLYKEFLSGKFIVSSLVLIFIGGIIVCGIGIYSIYDAYKNASS